MKLERATLPLILSNNCLFWEYFRKGKGEVFTYFLVGEDLFQRMRRMSIDKPEFFLSDNNNLGLSPIGTGSTESLDSHVLLLDETNLPMVIVTNATCSQT